MPIDPDLLNRLVCPRRRTPLSQTGPTALRCHGCRRPVFADSVYVTSLKTAG